MQVINFMKQKKDEYIIDDLSNYISKVRKHTKKEREFKTKVILLECPREILYNRINSRVDKMIEEGV